MHPVAFGMDAGATHFVACGDNFSATLHKHSEVTVARKIAVVYAPVYVSERGQLLSSAFVWHRAVTRERLT